MNKSPVEKYQESVRNLNDAVEEKRNEIITKLLQERTLVATEVELARKTYESKLADLNKIDKSLRELQSQFMQKRNLDSYNSDIIGLHYDSKYDSEDTHKSQNNHSFSRILGIGKRKNNSWFFKTILIKFPYWRDY